MRTKEWKLKNLKHRPFNKTKKAGEQGHNSGTNCFGAFKMVLSDFEEALMDGNKKKNRNNIDNNTLMIG